MWGKAGVPISPMLFSFVINGIFRGIPEEIGIKVDIWPLTVLAFADDLIMMAYSRVGLQTQLDRIRDYLQSVGLSVNALKSQTIAIKALGHQKKIVVDPSGSFKLLGYAIPALKRSDEFRYLGIPFKAAGGLNNNGRSIVREKLGKLTALPLKPQQWHWILQMSLYHHSII
ncbi:hypothetical protein GWI33_014716 [Rhynchophorus ferrugineus]|uniref:Reverse transcriptase domain-containing protein n=1 Tax=Rhynchophorus ferrugineus TaxID=354439 RepID=A0A834I6J0_RHYFE|nr:hypothetical protein GWI33_014716 [Rhynchophorus ferrugineus]